MEEAKQFGTRLRELRIKARLTQRELAEKVNVNFSYLSKIENGVLPPPSERVISQLAEILNADKDELLILAGKIPADIAQMLKNQRTLQLLRAEHQKKVKAQKREGVSLMKDFKNLTKGIPYKNIARVAIALTLVVAIGASIWYASPTKALEVSITPPSGNIGTTHSFAVSVTIKDYELIPIQSINLEIYNVSDTSKKATLSSLPLNSGSKSYSSVATGGGAASVTATPGTGWTYAYGTGYAEWNATAYSFSPPSVYGYAYSFSGEVSIVYGVSWTSPSGWPTGSYKIKVDVNASNPSVLTKTFTQTSSSFTLTAAAAPVSGVGAEPTLGPSVTNISDSINAQGVFIEDVTVESLDSVIELNIATNTVGKTADGKPLSEITITRILAPPDPPANTNIIGIAYDLEPDGATFAPPITLTFVYTPTLLPDGASEENMTLAYWDEDAGEWVLLDAEDITIDTEANTISARISHFTYFAVIAFTSPANLTVSDLTISPTTVDIADSVNIGATINNSGDLAGSYEATLKIDGEVMTTRKVTLAGHASEKVSFIAIKGAPKTYTVDVNGLTGTFTVRPITLPPAAPAPAPPAPPAPPPAPPAPAPAPAPPAPAPPPEVSIVLLIVIAVATIIVVGVVLWLVAFRREY